MVLGYVRVSHSDQNQQRQYPTMEEFGVEKIFEEKASAKTADRPKLQELLSFARSGDIICVHDFSRLARSTKDLLLIVEDLASRGIGLKSKKEDIDTTTPVGKLLLTVIGAIYTFELECNHERQMEGIKIAQAQGKYKGRKPISIEDFGEWYEKWKRREFTKTALAKELGISRQTLYKLFEEYEKTLINTTTNNTSEK